MGTFEIQRSTRLPSAAPLPRANINVDTGEQYIGAALERLGQTMFTLGEERKRARDTLELSSMQRQDTEIRLDAERQIRELQDPEDADAINKIWQDAQSARDSIQSKDGGVNQSFQVYRNGLDPQWSDKFHNVVGQRQRQSLTDNLDIEVRAAMETGDAKKIGVLYQTGLNANLYDKKTFDRMMDNIPTDMALAQADRSLDIDDPASAVTALDNVDVKSLDDARRETYKTLKIRSDKSKKIQDESLRQEIWDFITEKKYRTAQLLVDSSSLDTTGSGGKQQMTNMINSAMDRDYALTNAKTAAAENKAKNAIDNLEIGNSIMNASVEMGIDLDYTKWTPSKIWGLVKPDGSGIGSKVASRLVKRWQGYADEDASLTNPIAKKYISQANSVYQSGVFGNVGKTSSSNRFLAFKAQIENYIQSKGDSLTEQDMFKFWSDQLNYATGAGFWTAKPSGAEILGIPE